MKDDTSPCIATQTRIATHSVLTRCLGGKTPALTTQGQHNASAWQHCLLSPPHSSSWPITMSARHHQTSRRSASTAPATEKSEGSRQNSQPKHTSERQKKKGGKETRPDLGRGEERLLHVLALHRDDIRLERKALAANLQLAAHVQHRLHSEQTHTSFPNRDKSTVSECVIRSSAVS